MTKLDTRDAWAVLDQESGLRIELADTKKEATALAPKGATVKAIQVPQGYVVVSDETGERIVGPVASSKLADSEHDRLEAEAREHTAPTLNTQRIPDASNPGEFFDVPAEAVGLHPTPPRSYTVLTVDMPDDWKG